jgi:hypothetical protein
MDQVQRKSNTEGDLLITWVTIRRNMLHLVGRLVIQEMSSVINPGCGSMHSERKITSPCGVGRPLSVASGAKQMRCLT